MTRASLRKRRTKKGVGGRPAFTLYNVPDRWIVVTALWFRSDPREQRSLAILQALDFLLTPYDSIDVEVGTCVRERDGVEHGRLSMINTEPPRAPSGILENFPPDRQPLSAPGRKAFRRSRLKNLPEKVDRYRRAKLARQEELFLGLSHLAFNFIAHGDLFSAGSILAKIGWEMNDSTRSRLAEILSSPPIFPIASY
jgi:hypothetical protein